MFCSLLLACLYGVAAEQTCTEEKQTAEYYSWIEHLADFWQRLNAQHFHTSVEKTKDIPVIPRSRRSGFRTAQPFSIIFGEVSNYFEVKYFAVRMVRSKS
jgi:hypothetical protein